LVLTGNSVVCFGYQAEWPGFRSKHDDGEKDRVRVREWEMLRERSEISCGIEKPSAPLERKASRIGELSSHRYQSYKNGYTGAK
jgi:hypothetical protein